MYYSIGYYYGMLIRIQLLVVFSCFAIKANAQFSSVEIASSPINFGGMALGNNGYVTYVDTNGVNRYHAGVKEVFSTTFNGQEVSTFGINGRGQILGYTNPSSNVYKSHILDNSGYANLNIQTTSNLPYAISDEGFVVGTSVGKVNNLYYNQAFTYNTINQQLYLVPTPNISVNTSFKSVSSGGNLFVGGHRGAASYDSVRAILQTPTGIEEMGKLSGYEWSEVTAVNSKKDVVVVSSSYNFNSSRSFSRTELVKSNGQRLLVPSLGGDLLTMNYINNSGILAGGGSVGSEYSQALIWSETGGTVFLKPYLESLGFSNGQIYGLNDQGQVLVVAYKPNSGSNNTLLLLSPNVVPEPASFSAICIGIVAVLRKRRKILLNNNN
jgi:hypothetical protein